MTNRFRSIPNDREYVSQYVPQPLDFLLQAGNAAQSNLDNARITLDQSTDPLNKLKLSTSVKGYDNSGGVADLTIDLTKQRDEESKKLSEEREALTNSFINGHINQSTFYKGVRDHASKAKNIYNLFAQEESRLNSMAKANEKFSSSEEFALDPYYADTALKYNTDIVNAYRSEKGINGEYSMPGIAKKFDIQKAVKDIEVVVKGNERISIGQYITKYGTKGVSEKDVLDIANTLFSDPNSEVSQYAQLRTNYELNRFGLKGNEPTTMKVVTGYDKSGKPIVKEIATTYREKIMAAQKDSFARLAIGQKAGIQTTMDVNENKVYSDALKRKHELEDKKKESDFGFITEATTEGDEGNSDISDFIGNDGKFNINHESLLNKVLSNDYKVIINGKEYNPASQEVSLLGYEIAGNNKMRNKTTGELVDLVKTSKTDRKLKVEKFINEQGNRLNIVKKQGEDINSYANRVLDARKNASKNVSVNYNLHGINEDLPNDLNEVLLGTEASQKGAKLKTNYSDFNDGNGENIRDINKFLSEKGIKLESISHDKIDLNSDGRMVFTAFDENDKPVRFTAKPKSNKQRMILDSASDVQRRYKDYISGDSDLMGVKYKVDDDNKYELITDKNKYGTSDFDSSKDELQMVEGFKYEKDGSRTEVILKGNFSTKQIVVIPLEQYQKQTLTSAFYK